MVDKIQVNIEDIIAHSNRGPVKLESIKDIEKAKPYPGGLSTGLSPILGRGGIWVATAGNEFERRHFRSGIMEKIPYNGGFINFTEAVPTRTEYEDFYNGVSSELWFALHLTQPFHDMPHLAFPQPVVPEQKIYAYIRVNQKHVDVGMKLIKEKEGYVISNPQDFHLMYFSSMARKDMPKNGINPDKVLMFQFMHTPISNVKSLDQIIDQGHFYRPSANRLFRGLLGNNNILVQTKEFGDNLADIYKMFNLEVSDEGDSYYIVHHNLPNQRTHIMTSPIGIDTDRVRKVTMSHDPEVLNNYTIGTGRRRINLYDLIKEFREKGYTIVGNVERLDPTKGGLPRLYMLDLAIERSIEEGIKFIYIGFGPSSREGTLDKTFEDKVIEINNKYRDKLGHDVIFNKPEPLYFPDNISFMKELDIFTITPLDDGRNLTADEYIISQSLKPKEERGTLMLGNCGTQRVYNSHNLGYDDGIVNIDILDIQDSVDQFLKAIKEKPKISKNAIDVVNIYDVNNWFARNLDYLGHATGKQIEVVYK